jgi:opacity protein-like surface antigen
VPKQAPQPAPLHRLLPTLLLLLPLPLRAQAVATAGRAADLQIGIGVVLAHPGYDNNLNFKGGALYLDLDPRAHWGGEFVLHQIYTPETDHVYERTYEIGPRYVRTYGRLRPYAKLMYGRGVFNYTNDIANLGYNLFAAGGGTDYQLTRRINLRADYEYQRWLSFPAGSLTPQLLTIGVAYHFPGELRTH